MVVGLVMQSAWVAPEWAVLSVVVFVAVLLFQVQHVSKARIVAAAAVVLVLAIGCVVYAEDIVRPHPCSELTDSDPLWWAIGCWLFPPP